MSRVEYKIRNPEEDYLMHYGIKGMRWGVRRTPQQLGHSVRKGKSSVSANATKTLNSIGISYSVHKKKSQARAKVRATKKSQRQAKKQAKEDEKLAKIARKTKAIQTKNAYTEAKLKQRELRNKKYGIDTSSSGGKKEDGPVKAGVKQGIKSGVQKSVSNAIMRAMTAELDGNSKSSNSSKDIKNISSKKVDSIKDTKTGTDVVERYRATSIGTVQSYGAKVPTYSSAKKETKVISRS